MKTRWRENEFLFISILTAVELITTYFSLIYRTDQNSLQHQTALFHTEGIYFVPWRNEFLPQTGSILMIFLGYCAINKIIIPIARKMNRKNFFIAIAALLALSCFLALGANIFSYYGRPHLFDYANYQILALYGYNDHPLSNLTFGFQRAAGQSFLVFLLLLLREIAIGLIEKPDKKKEYRVMMANDISLVIVLYLLLMIYLNPIHREFIASLFISSGLLALYLCTTFWIFPMKGSKSFFYKPVLQRLALITFLCTFPMAVIFKFNDTILQFLLYWAILFFIVTPIFWLLYQTRREKLATILGIKTMLEHSAADLQMLRMQINPHFLFNALNTLYGTALVEHSDRTAEGIQKLGDMMRFMLYDNHADLISMEKEITYLRNFIDLQKLRLQESDRIEIKDNIEDSNCTLQVPPMLLIPFVENAFKHGISHQEQSWVFINLECSPDKIFFEVKNSVHKETVRDPETGRSGIGLQNLQERLTLLYPNLHELYLHQTDSEYIARLILKTAST